VIGLAFEDAGVELIGKGAGVRMRRGKLIGCTAQQNLVPSRSDALASKSAWLSTLYHGLTFFRSSMEIQADQMASTLWKEASVKEFMYFLLAPRRNDTPDRCKARQRYIAEILERKLQPHQRLVYFQGWYIDESPKQKRDKELTLLASVLVGQVIGPKVYKALSLQGWTWKCVDRRDCKKVLLLRNNRSVQVLEGKKITVTKAIEIAAQQFGVGIKTATHTYYANRKLVRLERI
jgi:hypothetical protein